MSLNDYARTPVPNNKTVSGWHIGLIYIGVGLTLPAFLVGSTVGANLGFWNGIIAVSVAGVILTGVAMLTGWVGAKVRLSTYFILQTTFGTKGAIALNLLLISTVFGWLGVTISMCAEALHSVLPFPIYSQLFWSIIGGTLMTATAVMGFKGLDKLSIVAVPILFGSLLWVSYLAVSSVGFEIIKNTSGSGDLPFGAVISMLVGGWMVGVSLLPDLSRYARTAADGSFGGFLCFLPGSIFTMTLAIIPTLAFAEPDFVKLMIIALGPIMAALIIILASWSSNDNNIYASSLGLASIIPKIPKWVITIIVGLMGMLVGIFGIMNYFTEFLSFLGIFIPPVAGVYTGDYFTNSTAYNTESDKKEIRLGPFMCWALGALMAWSTTNSAIGGGDILQLTSISALDGVLIAFMAMALFNLLLKCK